MYLNKIIYKYIILVNSFLEEKRLNFVSFKEGYFNKNLY